MVTTERFFAIPCPCGGRISVSAGQAGGRATCSECRREVDVPRLRDLAAYADDKDHVDKDHARDRVTAASGWDLSRGLVFAGCAAAGLAALAALAALQGDLAPASPPASPPAPPAACSAATPQDV